MNIKMFLLSIALDLFICSTCIPNGYAAPLYVELSGFCGGNLPCYANIQDAINASAIGGGDPIKVSEGNYSGPVTINTPSSVECCWNSDFTTMADTAPVVITGEVNTCDKSNCDTCVQSSCAIAVCITEQDACLNNQDCMDFITCYNACLNQSCINQCRLDYPTGNALFNAYVDCVYCSPNACLGNCSSFCPTIP